MFFCFLKKSFEEFKKKMETFICNVLAIMVFAILTISILLALRYVYERRFKKNFRRHLSGIDIPSKISVIEIQQEQYIKYKEELTNSNSKTMAVQKVENYLENLPIECHFPPPYSILINEKMNNQQEKKSIKSGAPPEYF